MTRNQMCREFHEACGGHWHEWTEDQGNQCKCGAYNYWGTRNPTYSHPEEVLKVMMGRDDKFAFLKSTFPSVRALVLFVLEPNDLLTDAHKWCVEHKE